MVGHLEFWDTWTEGEDGGMAMAKRASSSRDHSNSHHLKDASRAVYPVRFVVS